MSDNRTDNLVETASNDEAEEIFQLGLTAWENFAEGQSLEKAKALIGDAKSRGHELANMYWDIICAFEEAIEE